MLHGSINHISVTVSDLRRAMEFFGPLLGFLGYTVGGIGHDDRTGHDLSVNVNESSGTAFNIWPARIADARSDPRVIVEFTHPKGNTVSLTMEEQETAQDNLRVLFLALDAMRLNERRGIADVMGDAYLQLAAPEKQRDPYEVLGIRPDATPVVVEAAYKGLAKVHHPDKGGDPDEFVEIQGAYERIKAERGDG